jgi:diguanylate cyclase (GGDEF)-like protein
MRNIYVLDHQEEINNNLTALFKREKNTKVERYEFEDFFNEILTTPDVIIVNEDEIPEGSDIFSICKQIRADVDNTRTPIVVVSSNQEDSHIVNILQNDVELYLKKPLSYEILFYSIKNFLRLLNSNKTVSPLTGLPGNAQIQDQMNKRLEQGKNFQMFYVDLDNFKAYNDYYGFSNGDEIIKFTAKVLTTNVLKIEGSNNFVGHIGGDDFIAILEDENYEKIAQNIIADYDGQLENYFEKEDYQRGYLEIENRKGEMEQFPLTSISIGIVEVTPERFKNSLEIGEAGAAVKHLAKTIFGSSYVVDRRKKRDETFDKIKKKRVLV